MYSENKVVDQLRGYCAANVRVCFHICRVSHNETQILKYKKCCVDVNR